jgi:hypothetical protein
LAPGWKTGACDGACQEDISACLMAFTNGSGEHVAIEMASPNNALGYNTSSAYPYQEAAFYGNVFQSPPIARYCVGKDYAPKSWPGTNPGPGTTYSPAVHQRACAGYDSLAECPYVEENACNKYTGFWPPPPAAACGFTTTQYVCTKNWMGQTTCSNKSITSPSASSCKSTGPGARTWTHVITTFRKNVSG